MKTHLNLATRDLNASVAFYRSLLNAKAAKHHDDYALFVTDNPGLELALSLKADVTAASDVHYGIVVDKPASVDDAIARLANAGLAVDVETGQTCCYATQNKVWATDPDGRRWETYFVVAETEERSGDGMTCCQPADGGPASCC